MITDLDIQRSATVLVRRYGADALIHAAMRADELLALGVDGAIVWERIARAIERLQAMGRLQAPIPAEGATLH